MIQFTQKLKRRVLPLLLFLIIFIGVKDLRAQLTGTRTVGSGKDYASIAAAVTALNSSGVGAGGVTFNIDAGHTENIPTGGIVINIAGVNKPTLANPIVFQKTGIGANPRLNSIVGGSGSFDATSITTSNADAFIKLNGTDFITFDGIDMQEVYTGTTTSLITEVGFMFCRASSTDGCQNVTIKNCSLTFNNNPAILYTVGIRTTSLNSAGTSTTPSNDAGGHKNLKVFNCSIANAANGIYLYNNTTLTPYMDGGHEIGVDGAISITNMGANTTAYGVYTIYQMNIKIANTTITNKPTASSILYGINPTTANNSNVDIYNNTITFNRTVAGSSTYGIFNSAGGSGTNNTVNIYNNTTSNWTWTVPTTSLAYYIYNGASAFNLNVYGNSIQNNSYGAGASTATGTIFYLYLTGGTTANNIWKAYNNTIQGNIRNQSVTGTGTTYGLFVSSAAPTNQIYQNVIKKNTFRSSTGQMIFLYPNISGTLGEIYENLMDSNAINTSSSSAAYGIYRLGNIGSLNMYKNLVTNTTVTGATSGAFYHVFSSGAASPSVQTIYNNRVENFTSTGATSTYGLYLNGAASGTKILSYGDTITNLNSAGGSVFGAYLLTADTNRFYKNFISNLGTTSGFVYGIYAQGSTSSNIYTYNNFISDLTVTNSTQAPGVVGLFCASGQNIGAYYNTIYLNASSSSTSFGSAAVYSSSSPGNLDFRNNLFINNSVPGGGSSNAKTVAYWRSASGSYSNHSSGSNNNDYYGGSPGANNLVFYESSILSGDQTMASFKTRLGSEASSFSSLPPFLDATSIPKDLRLSLIVGTQAESGGTSINSPVDITGDFFGSTRFGEASYSGAGSAPDVGAFEDDMIGLDLIAPAITFTNLGNSPVTVTRDLSNVVITDASMVDTVGRPRLYYKRSTDNNALASSNDSLGNGWKFVVATGSGNSPFSFTINHQLLTNPSASTVGDVIQYFVVAADLSAASNVGIQAGSFAATPSSVALTGSAFPIGGTLRTYSFVPTLSGTYTVGTGGDYPSLTGVGGLFEDFNSKTVTGNVTAKIISDISETGAVGLNQWSEFGGSGFSLTITPHDTVSSLIDLTGNIIGSLIRLNGADNVSIDGRINGSGKWIRIVNSNVSGNAISFASDAKNNTITYCKIEGRNTSTLSGTIIFGSASIENSNNTISHNDIGDDAGNIPVNSIFSASNRNHSNSIINNNIYNFSSSGVRWSTGGASSGAGNSWVINQNRFYQTASRTSVLYGVYLQSGAGHTLDGNGFGGNDSARGGVLNSTSSTYYGIFIENGIGLQATISNNTLANVRAAGVYGVYLSNADALISSNTFGGMALANDTIISSGLLYSVFKINGGVVEARKNRIANQRSASTFYGIYLNGASGHVIDSNEIKFLSCASTSYFIYTLSGASNVTISNNQINNTNSTGLTAPIFVQSLGTNSVSNNQINNITATSTFYGLYTASTAPAITNFNNNVLTDFTLGSTSYIYYATSTGTNNFNNNQLRRVTQSAGTAYTTYITSTSTNNFTNNIWDSISILTTSTSYFIYPQAGSTNTFTNNTISNVEYTQNASPRLFSNLSSSGPLSFVGNSFSNIQATAASSQLYGIYVGGGLLNFERNSLTNFTANSAIYGLFLANSAGGEVKNNAMAFGGNENVNLTIYGLYEGIAANFNYNFNTIYLEGNTTNTNTSAAYFKASTGTPTLRNNNFINNRGVSNNFGIYISSTTGWVGSNSNYNNLYSRTANNVGFYSGARTFDAWKTNASSDLNSISLDPAFNTYPSLEPSPLSPVLGAGTPIVGINNDIAGNTRNVTNPSIGAYELGRDLAGPVISYTNLPNTLSTANRTLSNVTITDFSGVQVGSGLKPRLYYRSNSHANTFAGNSNSNNGWKFVEANNATSPFNFTIDYSKLNTPVIMGTVIEYFVIAQDSVSTTNVGTNTATFSLKPTSVDLAAVNFPVSGSINSYKISSVSFIDTVKVGVGQTYTSLTNPGGLFDSLNNNVLIGNLIIEITSNLTSETGEYALNAMNEEGVGNYQTRMISNSAVTISGTAANALIRLNGVTRFSIDGGNSKNITIRNNHFANAALAFVNNCSYDTIVNCNLESENTLTSGSNAGTVNFGMGSSANSYIVINKNNIRNSSANGNNSIIGINSSASGNSNLVISENEIYNFGNFGIYFSSSSGNSNCTIHSNSFYRTTGSAVGTQYMIYSDGTGIRAYNNEMGGSTSNHSGSAFSTNGQFYGIFVLGQTLIAGDTALIYNNKIANISSSGFFGIYITGGNSKIYNNNIGGTTNSYDAISSTSTIYGIFNLTNASSSQIYNNTISKITGTTTFYGIYNTAPGSLSVYNNSFDNNTESGTGAFMGAYITNANSIIYNNILRDNIAATGISYGIYPQPTAPNTSYVYGNEIYNYAIQGALYGIFNAGTGNATDSANAVYNVTATGTGLSLGIYTGGTGINRVINNEVRDFVNQSTGAIYGLYAASGTNYLANNNLKNYSTNATASVSLMGIYLLPSTSGNVVEKNVIRNLNLTSTTNQASAAGIYVTNANSLSARTEILANEVSDLFSSSNLAAPNNSSLNGIVAFSGSATYANNVINIGNGVSSNASVYGLVSSGSGANNFYFNSISVLGSMTDINAYNPSAAYRKNGTGIDTVRNNIFSNQRKGSSSAHYSARVESTVNWASGLYDNNLWYQETDTFGVFGTQFYLTFADWKIASASDAASVFGNPKYNSTSNLRLVPGSAASSVSAFLGTGYNSDITGITRTAHTIGAYDSLYDNGAPVIEYTALNNITSTSNRVFSNIVITDPSGVSVANGFKPRLYYKALTNANTYVGNTSSDNGWKFVEPNNAVSPFEFTIDYSKIFGGISGGEEIQYFVIAQDSSAIANVGNNTATFTLNPSSVQLSAANFPVSGSINKYRVQILISGNINVGSGNPITSLTNSDGAFNYINGNIISGDITLSITSNTTESGEVALAKWTESGMGNYGVKIVPASASVKELSGSFNGSLIRLDSAKNVSIKGDFSGAGQYLLFRNTNVSGSTLTLQNGSTNDSIANLILEGANATGVGTLVIGSGGIPQKNIWILNNQIRDLSLGSGVPTNAIVSLSNLNDSIYIDGNEIFNYTANGIRGLANAAGNGWKINNNKIYQTANRSSQLKGIILLSGAGHTLTNNQIGGSNNIGGGAATLTTSSTFPSFSGIEMNSLNAGGLNQINNNKIANISATSLYGIYLLSNGDFEVKSNTIGGQNAAYDTLRTSSTTYLIYSANVNAPIIRGNFVKGLNSNSVVYSIYATTGLNAIIDSNNVENVITSSTNYAIYASGGTNVSINNNVVKNLSGATSAGIYTNVGGNGTILSNSVSLFSASSTFYGLYITNGINTVSKNLVFDITGVTTSYGIFNSSILGAAIYNNNAISMGSKFAGNVSIYGIYTSTTQANEFNYNSVNITGNSSSTALCAAFYRNSTGAVTLKNNAFVNTRGSSANSAIYIASITGWVGANSDYNLLYSSNLNNIGYYNGVYSTFALWKTNAAVDANSISSVPNFNSNESLMPFPGSPLLGAATTLVSVGDDINGVSRSVTPTIGAYENAGDEAGPSIVFTAPAKVSPAGAVLSNVLITDPSGVDTAAFRPRMYYKKLTDANAFVGNTSADNGWKFSLANGTGNSPFSFDFDFTKLFGGSAITGDQIEYFIVAQDLYTTPNLSSSSGSMATDASSTALISGNFPVSNASRITLVRALSGTILVGPTEQITSLTSANGAFQLINSNVVSGDLTISVTGNLTETAANALNQTDESGVGSYQIRIVPSSSALRTITGNFAGGLIRLNGADRVTIDGNDGAGNNAFTIQNTSTSTHAVIQYISLGTNMGAENDTLRYCNLIGGSNTITSSYGVFLGGISVGSSAVDIRNIYISNNAISRAYYG
ncbi:MAG: hypothetical protein Q8R57_03325, partial [Bacteroidota bacterium]|nr:hypothetical protein [Bacteroidota bacterium]